MGLSLLDAAEVARIKPSTIFRAILSGRLAFERDEDGSYVFDPEELEKVFSPDRRVDPVPLAQVRIVPPVAQPNAM